jgi:hypothetical protein
MPVLGWCTVHLSDVTHLECNASRFASEYAAARLIVVFEHHDARIRPDPSRRWASFPSRRAGGGRTARSLPTVRSAGLPFSEPSGRTPLGARDKERGQVALRNEIYTQPNTRPCRDQLVLTVSSGRAADAPRPGENKVPKQDLAVGLCALRGTSATHWRSMDA